MSARRSLLEAPWDCPNDPDFEHDNYFGCVPKDFSTTTGKSKTHRQRYPSQKRRSAIATDGTGCDAQQ